MFSRKRFKLAVMMCLVFLLAFSAPALAADKITEADYADTDINPSPRFTYINQVTTNLSTSASGITASGSIIAYPSMVDKVCIFLYLERYENGVWLTVNSWSKVFYSYHGYLEGFSAVPRGYYYRVRASYYAWSGSNFEYTTGNTGPRYY